MPVSFQVVREIKSLKEAGLFVVPSVWREVSCLPSSVASAWKSQAERMADLSELAKEGLVSVLPGGGWLLVIGMRAAGQGLPMALVGRVLEVAEQVRAGRVAVLTGAGAGNPLALAEALRLAAYRHTAYKSKPSPSHVDSIVLVAPSAATAPAAEIDRLNHLLDGVDLARDLANTPAMDLTPEDLAARAGQLAQAEGLDFDCWYEADLQAHGCTGLLAVGKGAAHPPVMIRLDYAPKPLRGKATTRASKTARPRAHLALVGKGVCFDTGGISIKPAADMWRMKGDMAGAAAVLGAMLAIARLKPAIPVTALIPSAINAVDAHSTLPGDVIRARNGKTVMVDNTDAEGRLILMDALHEAGLAGATHCVDVATLTGACSRALGPALSGLFANDDDLAAALATISARHDEALWRLPLVEEYVPMLKNDTADLNNIGNSGTAGAITAALFLREFVPPKMKWAHLDIAGTGLPSKPRPGMPPGATGVPVRTLAQYALSLGK